MAEETPLDAPVPDDQVEPDPGTLGSDALPLALPPRLAAKEYRLTRGEQRFAVLQYVDDMEVTETETIQYFLNFCRDMGWSIEVEVIE